MVREATFDDLGALLLLYLCLHEESIPADSAQLQTTWKQILADPNHHVIVYELHGQIVSSCVCVVIPNLSRGVRPYALVENVVTHTGHRGRGFASACLARAKELAMQKGCYKIMLLTGAKDEHTLAFYERAGYNRHDKTAFIQRL